ncbi:MAG: hypothetical protein RIB59_04450, partial [Rhodospirillales bacterium]
MAEESSFNFEELISNPLFNFGIGVLAASGPSTKPVSFGQGLLGGLQAAQGAQRQKVANQLVRARLEQQAKQSKAQGLLGELISKQSLLTQGAGRVGPTTQAADRLASGQSPEQALGGDQKTQLLGLLADAAPEQFTQSLLGHLLPAPAKERSETGLVRNIRAAGIDPQSEEGRNLIKQNIIKNGGTIDQLDAVLKTLNIKKIQADLAKESRTERVNQKRAEIGVINTLEAVKRMAKLNDELEGTFLESGATFSDARRALASGVGFLGRLTGLSD